MQIFEAKFLCNDDLYTVTLNTPKKLLERIGLDGWIANVIEAEKTYQNIEHIPHTLTELKRSEDNGITWVEMI